MNQELFEVLTKHARWFTQRFGQTLPEHFLFPAGRRWPDDPTQPIGSFKRGWGAIRRKAKVSCRIHDLRHTAITKLAESGASDSTIMAFAGHLSRAMMERYCHIRMNAKRQAVESLSLNSLSTHVTWLDDSETISCRPNCELTETGHTPRGDGWELFFYDGSDGLKYLVARKGSLESGWCELPDESTANEDLGS
jgi:hypothetical protein